MELEREGLAECMRMTAALCAGLDESSIFACDDGDDGIDDVEDERSKEKCMEDERPKGDAECDGASIEEVRACIVDLEEVVHRRSVNIAKITGTGVN